MLNIDLTSRIQRLTDDIEDVRIRIDVVGELIDNVLDKGCDYEENN